MGVVLKSAQGHKTPQITEEPHLSPPLSPSSIYILYTRQWNNKLFLM
jgi:hypothetical protein